MSCRVWDGALDRTGAPMFRSPGALTGSRRVRREVIAMVSGLAEGDDVVWTCGTPGCFNADHGVAVSHGLRIALAQRALKSHLTWADVRELRAAAAAGVKQVVLQERYGLSRNGVTSIVTNRTWKDPSYVPGVERACALPDCGGRFRTTKSNQLFCSRRCRTRHNCRERSGFYLRREEAGWMARRTGVGQPGRALHNASSLDRPLGEDGTATLRDFAADGQGVDPQAELEAGELRALLAGLDEEAVARMSERELAALRAHLARAGYVPAAR